MISKRSTSIIRHVSSKCHTRAITRKMLFKYYANSLPAMIGNTPKLIFHCSYKHVTIYVCVNITRLVELEIILRTDNFVYDSNINKNIIRSHVAFCFAKLNNIVLI